MEMEVEREIGGNRDKPTGSGSQGGKGKARINL